MELFRVPGENQDRLLLLTEKSKMCVIRWNRTLNQCETLTTGDVLDHLVYRGETLRLGSVDPLARCIGLHQNQHLLKILPTDYTRESTSFNVRLVEEDVLDFVFLHDCAKPTVALLHKETGTASCTNLRTYEINLADQDIVSGNWFHSDLDVTASKLVAVPSPIGGVLVISCHNIVYLRSDGKCVNQGIDSTIIQAVGMVDQKGNRFLLGDSKGQLMLLVLVLTDDKKSVARLELQMLGETSVASTISYLDSGFVFIGSDQGDSQLIRLHTTKFGETNCNIEVCHVYPHLGPITDFCIVKGMGYLRQGQGQVVTCSGMGKDGSLRIIRNGIGISEQAAADLPGIKAMFSLRRHIDDEYHSYILQSFTSETRTLELIGAFDMAPVVLPFLDETSPTLHAGNMVGDRIVQVTADGVRLLDCATKLGTPEPAWRAPDGAYVSSASGNKSQLLLACTGNSLMYLEVNGTNGELSEVKRTQFENEISCVDCSPLVHTVEVSGMVEPEESAQIAVVGLWAAMKQSPVVKILALPSLETLHTVELGGDVMARSVLMATLDGVNYLLVGLGDGYLMAYTINLEAAIAAAKAAAGGMTTPIVGEGRKLNVGTQPANLSVFRSHGANHVFAACDRPTVVYASGGTGKLLLSNVNLQEVTRVCGFHTKSFPDCLAIASESMFQLGAVDEIQKLHITPVPLGEQPRRIAYHESARTFVVLTERTQIDIKGEDMIEAYVRLVHDSTFDTLHKYQLMKHELGLAIAVSVFPTGGDSSTEYVVVGTTFELPNEEDPKKGRILIFAVRENRLVLVCEHQVSGATYSLCPFDGRIVAGVNSLVIVFSLKEDASGSLSLVKDDVHHSHILAYRIKARGQFILVGDLMRSVTLLAWKQLGENRLEEVARDYDSGWTVAMEMLDEDMYIMSEHTKHLFTFRRNTYAASESERMQLERVGMFHVGANVNKIMHGSLVMQVPEAESPALKTLIFGTADGMLGVIASLKPEAFQFFNDLAKAMVSVVPGVGGLKHAEWREMFIETPYRTAASKNYVDGDLIERFGDLGADKKREVSRIVGVGVEDLTRRVEEMQRLHGAG